MNRHFEQVKKFHAAAGIEMPTTPTMLDRGISYVDGIRLDCLADDLEKYCEQMKSTVLGGEVMKRAAYILEETIELLRAKTIEDQADALADIQYFTIGTHTLMGVKPERIFDIVANANLGKILPDGTVLRNDQGKIMKPAGWEENYAPEGKIIEEIERQKDQKYSTVPPKTSTYLYALEKYAARESFMDFIEDWGITHEEYEEIAKFLSEHGLRGYITR